MTAYNTQYKNVYRSWTKTTKALSNCHKKQFTQSKYENTRTTDAIHHCDVSANFFTASFFIQCQFLLYPCTRHSVQCSNVPSFFFCFSLKIGFHCLTVFCSCYPKSVTVHLLIYTNCLALFQSRNAFTWRL